MTIEIRRFRRRFMSFSGSRSANSAVFVLVILCYGILTFSIFSAKGAIPPSTVLMLQTLLFCFLGPAMLYGSIAGERERRSWDLLLVAPLTHAQIVVGKFLGAIAALGIAAVAGFIPMIAAYAIFDNRFDNGHRAFFGDLLESELISLTFGMVVCSLTIFFSARVKRPLVALGTTLGALVVFLLAIPTIVAAEVTSDQSFVSTFLFGHPFYAQARLGTDAFGRSEGQGLPLSMYGVPQSVIYLGLTIVFLTWATKTLVFAENDVKFMPKGQQDA